MSKITIEKVVEKIYELKDRRTEYNDKIKEIKEVEEKLKNYLLSALQKNELSKMGVKCSAGNVTVFTKNTTKVGVADWDEVLGFIKQSGAYDLLTHNVNSSAVKEMMDNGVSVPGVNTFTELTLCIQKR